MFETMKDVEKVIVDLFWWCIDIRPAGSGSQRLEGVSDYDGPATEGAAESELHAGGRGRLSSNKQLELALSFACRYFVAVLPAR